MTSYDLSGLTRITSRVPYSALGSATLDGSGEYVGHVFIADRTGTVDRVKIRTGTVTGTAPTYRVGIESPTQNSGSVDLGGAYLNSGNAYVDSSTWESNTVYELTLGATVSVTRGHAYAVSIRHQSGTIDGSNNVIFATGSTGLASNLPCVIVNTGALANETRVPAVSVRYDDGEWNSGSAAYSAIATSGWNSSSTPRYRGNRFVPAVDIRVREIVSFVRRGASTPTTFDIEVYKNNESSPTVELAVNPDWLSGGTTGASSAVIAETVLTAGDVWRVVVNPTSTTNFAAAPNIITFATSGERAAMFGDFSYTNASSPGTWTDDDTSVMMVYPIVAGVDAASGGGTRAWFE